jgi:hypothetical protein
VGKKPRTGCHRCLASCRERIVCIINPLLARSPTGQGGVQAWKHGMHKRLQRASMKKPR